MSMDAILCKKRTRQINKLSPTWGWGRRVPRSFDAGRDMREAAKTLEREAEILEKYYVKTVGSGCQQVAVLRTARQIRETADRIRREAGEACWLSDDYNVVDLANAKPQLVDSQQGASE